MLSALSTLFRKLLSDDSLHQMQCRKLCRIIVIIAQNRYLYVPIRICIQKYVLLCVRKQQNFN